MTSTAGLKSMEVNPKDLTPQMLDGLLKCCAVYIHAGQGFTVTSLNDSKHSFKSLHYSGCAADLRTRDLKGITPEEMKVRLKDALGKDFDVVVESDHIHVEYDPK